MLMPCRKGREGRWECKLSGISANCEQEDAQKCTITVNADEGLFESNLPAGFPGPLTLTGPSQMPLKSKLLWKSLHLSVQGNFLSITE